MTGLVLLPLSTMKFRPSGSQRIWDLLCFLGIQVSKTNRHVEVVSHIDVVTDCAVMGTGRKRRAARNLKDVKF